MSLLRGLMGDATELDISNTEQELTTILIEGEKVERAFKLVRDLFIFTNKRLIFIDKQGMTGKKTDYLSLPYKNISHFSLRTTGHLDLDAELNIWIIGHSTPLSQQFKRGSNLELVHKTLATYVIS